MSTPIRLGPHSGWRHDEGHPGGLFHTFDALDLGFLGPRKVHVWTPRVSPPATGFPTLYVHDGDTTFWRGGVAHATWDLARVLSAPGIGPYVVVALHPVRRNWEYTHVPWAQGQPWGGLPSYAEWLARVVKPWVDQHFPTDPRRVATTVFGSSHGGLASFFTATRHPDVFGAAGCLSSSFFSGLDDLRDGSQGPARLVASPLVEPVSAVLADPALRPWLWLDWGMRREGGDHNAIVERLATFRGRELSELLQARFGYVEGVDLHPVEDPEGAHDEASWSRRVGWMLSRLPAPGSAP